MKAAPRYVLALFALIFATGCDGTDRPTGPEDDDGPADELAGTLVYSTFDLATGAWGVATAGFDGSDPTPLPLSVENPGRDPDLVFFSFQWSPDGERLVFRSSRTNTDDWALALVEADGSRKRFVTHPDGFALDARWSPKGDRILYDRGGLVGDQLGIAFQTAIADTAGVSLDFFVEDDGALFQGQRVHFSLLAIPDSSFFDPVPALYEAAFGPGDDELYVLGAVGRPMWAAGDPTDVELFRVSVTTGRVLERLTDNEVDEAGFQLSPDGSTILLTRPYGPTASPAEFRLYTMPARGGTELRRITGEFHEIPARWASDSRHVVFMRPVAGQLRIYVVDAEGSGEERLVTTGGVQPDLFIH